MLTANLKLMDWNNRLKRNMRWIKLRRLTLLLGCLVKSFGAKIKE
jgi:hypothetical protein